MILPLFVVASVLAAGLGLALLQAFRRHPENWSGLLFGVNRALLVGMFLLLGLRFVEELGRPFSELVELFCQHAYAVTAPFYGVMLLLHIWANRDYFRK